MPAWKELLPVEITGHLFMQPDVEGDTETAGGCSADGGSLEDGTPDTAAMVLERQKTYRKYGTRKACTVVSAHS